MKAEVVGFRIISSDFIASNLIITMQTYRVEEVEGTRYRVSGKLMSTDQRYPIEGHLLCLVLCSIFFDLVESPRSVYLATKPDTGTFFYSKSM